MKKKKLKRQVESLNARITKLESPPQVNTIGFLSPPV